MTQIETQRHKTVHLSKWHDVVLNVRPAHRLRMLIIVCYHYGDIGIILAYAVDEIFQFVVA